MLFEWNILIAISIIPVFFMCLADELYAQTPSGGIHDNISRYSNPDFVFVNNATSFIAYGLDAFWSDPNGSCETNYKCISNYTSGWNDNASLQLSTGVTDNYTWSWIFGDELSVKPGERYELITHMKLNDYARESFVALEGFNETSGTWNSVGLHCPEDVGWIPPVSSKYSPGIWQASSCEVYIPFNTSKVRPILNAGWSSIDGHEGVTWFESISLLPINRS